MHSINVNMKNFKITNYDCDVRPFEFKVDIENLSGLTKQCEMKTKYQKTDIFGKKLYYTQMNGRSIELTEDNIGTYNADPIYICKTENVKIDLINNPTKFTFDEVIEYKKKELLANTGFTDCILYECNLDALIDTEYSENGCDCGFKIINVHSNGGKAKLHIETNKESIKEMKLFFGDLSVEYSINGSDYVSYTDVIKIENNINTIDIILTNNSEKDVKYTNIYILMK